MKCLAVVLTCLLVLDGCGGGSSRTRITTAPLANGEFTLLVGDAALDGVTAVNIDIDEVVLIGAGGQLELATAEIDIINLLALRNVTELVAVTDVPARTYNKVRLRINSLQVVEQDGDVVAVQLPANGKIDLNPRGPFAISPNEDLVMQLDFDLQRSIKLVTTGNSQYRFRPVVFIEVIDQTGNLRLTKLVGTVEDDDTGGASDFDLCDVADPQLCFDVTLDENPLLLQVDGTPATLENLERGAEASVFGHFFIGAQGGDFFRALIVVMGAEDSIEQIDGDVASLLVDGEFDLLANGAAESTIVQLGAGAKLLDGAGVALSGDIAIGQQAEAWAQTSQLDLAEPNEFPAFLVQVSDDDEQDSVEGALVAIDGNELTVESDDGQVCAIVASAAEIQLLVGYFADAEVEILSLAELTTRFMNGMQLDVEAFGTQDETCLTATVVVVEDD